MSLPKDDALSVHQVWLNPEKKNDAIQMHCLKKAVEAMAQVTTPLTPAEGLEVLVTVFWQTGTRASHYGE